MFLSYPWENTSLGPLEMWQTSYRAWATACLTTPLACSMALGNGLITIYNDSFRGLAAMRHPHLFGSTMEAGWGNVWKQTIRPMVKKVMDQKIALKQKDHLIWMQRLNKFSDVDYSDRGTAESLFASHHTLEETYHSFTYFPLCVVHSEPAHGFMNIDLETTDAVIAQRRLETARIMSTAITSCQTLPQFYRAITAGLEGNPIDVPFLMVYSCTTHESGYVYTRKYFRRAPHISITAGVVVITTLIFLGV